MKSFIFWLEYGLIRFVGFLINLLPFSTALNLAKPIGAFLFHVLKRQRNRALDNLRQAFKNEKTESEIIEIAKGSFVFLVEFGVEWLRIPILCKSPDQYFSVRNVKLVHDAFKEKKGVIFLVSHSSNQELMAVITGYLITQPVNETVYAVARPIKNHILYDFIVRVRGIFGTKIIDKQGAVRETLKRLKQNAIVAILIDQRVAEGQTTQFFGRSAITTSLPAMAAVRYGSPVFYVSLARTPDLKFVFDIKPVPVRITGNQSNDVEVATQEFNDLLESEIRKAPSHWLWMHNRWRMPGEAK